LCVLNPLSVKQNTNNTMANWNKLNAELDAVLDNMTSEDWANWKKNREHNKLMRSIRMKMEANLHFQRLSSEGQFKDAIKIIVQTTTSNDFISSIPTSHTHLATVFQSNELSGKSQLPKIAFSDEMFTGNILIAGNANFAMAA
jgi:hypothetical protein